MKNVRARRLAVLAASAVAIGSLGTGADAATGGIGYSCKITDDFKYTFTFDQDTNANAPAYAGKNYVYSARTDFPEAGVAFARSLGVTYIDGAIDATVLVNGAPITIHAPIPRTNVPTNTNQMSLVAQGILPARPAGAVTYKPSTILFSVNAHKADSSSLFALNKGTCTMPANTKTIDTASYVKSPTKTTPAVAYAKAAKKVTAIAKLTATSGVVPTGKVTAVLFKGATKLKTKVVSLVGGKATAVFTGVKAKGGYKVVLTYAGSSAHHGSGATKTFRIR